MAIKAVVFDWGDVYLCWKREFWKVIASRINVPVEVLEKEVYRHWDLLNLGTIDDKGFWSRLAKGLGIKLPEESANWLEERISTDLYVNKDVEAIARSIKRAGYKTALLSNTEKTSIAYGIRNGWTKYFDEIIASCDLGLMKPDERIFNIATERIGEMAEECVFIENQPRHIEAAKRLGWNVILFDNRKQGTDYLKKKLNELGIRREIFED
jgi:epoxide hydrolase-like predicted phosphatase